MSARFKPVDREQPFLMPPDLKEWIPANHIVHFTIEAANMVPTHRFVVNERGDEVGADLERLTVLRAKMKAAQKNLEKRAKEGSERERQEYERKLKDRNDRRGSRKGRHIKEPEEGPQASEQANLTDDDSRIMRKNRRSEYTQAYNAQAVVDAEGTMLVVASRVTNNATDVNELGADIAAIDGAVGTPETVLADAGYANGEQIVALQERCMTVLVPVPGQAAPSTRIHDFRPQRSVTPPETKRRHRKEWAKQMSSTMATPCAKELYRLRKQSVEPVFGIIKQALGFRQFLLRGLGKVELEWRLVTCAYNLKRLASICSIT